MAKIALISTDVYIYSHGVRAISAYLKKHRHEVIILSMPLPYAINEDNQFRQNFKQLKYSKKTLESMKNLVKECDLIGLSGVAAHTKRTLQIIKTLKPLKIPIIWGGIFATTFPEFCIKHADIVCVGEGEEALLELANKIDKKQNYHKTKNFWFKVKGKNNKEKIIKNSLRNLLEDLDEIPLQDYNQETNFVLEKNKYFKKLNKKHIGGWLYYHRTRGCAFSCKYCSNCHLQKLYKNKGSRIRKKSIKLVIKDLEILKKQFPELRWIWFTDDDINLWSLPEIKEFSRLYKEKINLPFRAYMTPTTVNEEKLKLLLKAGLNQIELGIQTGSDNINKHIYNRPVLKKDVLKASKLIHKYRKKMAELPNYQIITTNPYESKKDILETIELLKQIPPSYHLSPFGLVFFPGTPLYYRAIKDKHIKTFEDSAYDLDYTDSHQHLKLKQKNLYLNTILSLMEGNITKLHYGLIPRFALKYLIKDKTIKYFSKHPRLTLKFSRVFCTLTNRLIFLEKIRIKLNKLKEFIYSLIPKNIKEPIKKILRLD